MTEEEARKMRCCGPDGCGEWRADDLAPGEDWLTTPNTSRRRCIGSACMAWRWQDDIERRWTQEPPEGEGWQRIEAIGGVAHWARTHTKPHGNCGLARQPHDR